MALDNRGRGNPNDEGFIERDPKRPLENWSPETASVFEQTQKSLKAIKFNSPPISTAGNMSNNSYAQQLALVLKLQQAMQQFHATITQNLDQYRTTATYLSSSILEGVFTRQLGADFSITEKTVNDLLASLYARELHLIDQEVQRLTALQ